MGGVPVGYEVARALKAGFDLLICRKLLIPWNREAGFGAVDPDGNVFVDEGLASALGLGREQVEDAVREQLEEIRRRNVVLRRGRPYPRLDGRRIVIVDDGVAAGYTMMAAVRFARGRGANKVYVATPTGHVESINRLSRVADMVICVCNCE
jgi:predicted phosphoribosyltransferase